MSAGALRPTGTPLGTGAGGPGNATPVTRPTASGYEIDITTLDGKPIAASIKAPILHCIRLIRPVTPFRLILQDIGGRLYVADQSPPNELKQSTDFRDCLKTDFHGKIDAKELSLKGFLRPKTSQ